MRKITTLDQQILDNTSLTWSEKEEIIHYLFQNGQIKISDFLKIGELLYKKREKWIKDNWPISPFYQQGTMIEVE